MRWLAMLVLAASCASPPDTADEVALELAKAYEEIARLEGEVAAQRAALERTADEEVKWLRLVLAEYRRRHGDMGSSRGPEGRVVRVDGTSVTISVGSGDGTEVGDVYHIRRGKSYVGQCVIDGVEKSLSRGVFDTQFPGPAAPPRLGDIAYPGG